MLGSSGRTGESGGDVYARVPLIRCGVGESALFSPPAFLTLTSEDARAMLHKALAAVNGARVRLLWRGHASSWAPSSACDGEESEAAPPSPLAALAEDLVRLVEGFILPATPDAIEGWL